MGTIKTLDIGTSCCCPISDDRGRTSWAAWLVGKLPRKDGGAGLVPAYDGVDVLLVLRLAIRVAVPVILGHAVVVGVDSHAAKVSPEVNKGDNELHIVFHSCGNDGVEFL